MRLTRLVVPVLFALLALTGCGTLSGVSDTLAENQTGAKIAVQYATLKTIEESRSIEATDVQEHVARVRDKVLTDDSIALSRLRSEVRASIDFNGLTASDRLLLVTLLDVIESSVGEVTAPEVSSPLNEEQRVRVLTLLDWVEQAARMAG